MTITKAGPWNSQKWPSAASIMWRGHPGNRIIGLVEVLTMQAWWVSVGGHGCASQLGHAMSGAE